MEPGEYEVKIDQRCNTQDADEDQGTQSRPAGRPVEQIPESVFQQRSADNTANQQEQACPQADGKRSGHQLLDVHHVQHFPVAVQRNVGSSEIYAHVQEFVIIVEVVDDLIRCAVELGSLESGAFGDAVSPPVVAVDPVAVGDVAHVGGDEENGQREGE